MQNMKYKRPINYRNLNRQWLTKEHITKLKCTTRKVELMSSGKNIN